MNLTIYRATNVQLNPVLLTQNLLQPLGDFDRERSGWVNVIDEPPALGVIWDGRTFVKLGTNKRLLPADVVKSAVAERVAAVTQEQGFRPGRKQTREIKEAVIDELLPRAFVQLRTTLAWIDPVGGWLVVMGKADEVVKLLSAYGTFAPLTVPDMAGRLTTWLTDGVPDAFLVDETCELVGEGGQTAQFKHHDLDTGSVLQHVGLGKHVTKLAMTWNDRVSFTLTDKLLVKSFKMLDVGESSDASELALLSGELSRFVPALVEALQK